MVRMSLPKAPILALFKLTHVNFKQETLLLHLATSERNNIPRSLRFAKNS